MYNKFEIVIKFQSSCLMIHLFSSIFLRVSIPTKNCISKMSSSILSDVLSFSVAAAEKGGEIVRQVLSTGKLGVLEKTGINDLQTLADRRVSDVLQMSFCKSFPGLRVISEEGNHYFDEAGSKKFIVSSSKSQNPYCVPEELQNVSLEDITVWIDPLDGTKEFADGFLERVTVLIGIAVQGKAIAGVVHQPYYKRDGNMGRTLYGAIGGKVEINFVKQSPSKDGKIIVTTRSHSTKIVDEVINTLNPSEVLRVGGAGYKVLMLLDGQADAYVFPTPGCKKWDTCAPEAILHALGGRLTDIWGNNYLYNFDVQHINEWGVIASANANDHQSLIEQIPEDLKKQVRDCYKK
ncbi:3'(2'),5'-bisphosphate nucleotidase 1 isoform X1 [Lepeophtheirus salmonis]|nr:3'(2'),5'-bisphosphate nucleotidase 1-like isoform X1 [Lepeophtheirus salmonis]XP_040567691.1 3'(2'),5'-bisphosphate nucleotidase 1-like isoform X1 [Lepeophtheirus salmonis]